MISSHGRFQPHFPVHARRREHPDIRSGNLVVFAAGKDELDFFDGISLNIYGHGHVLPYVHGAVIQNDFAGRIIFAYIFGIHVYLKSRIFQHTVELYPQSEGKMIVITALPFSVIGYIAGVADCNFIAEPAVDAPCIEPAPVTGRVNFHLRPRQFFQAPQVGFIPFVRFQNRRRISPCIEIIHHNDVFFVIFRSSLLIADTDRKSVLVFFADDVALSYVAVRERKGKRSVILLRDFRRSFRNAKNAAFQIVKFQTGARPSVRRVLQTPVRTVSEDGFFVSVRDSAEIIIAVNRNVIIGKRLFDAAALRAFDRRQQLCYFIVFKGYFIVGFSFIVQFREPAGGVIDESLRQLVITGNGFYENAVFKIQLISRRVVNQFAVPVVFQQQIGA